MPDYTFQRGEANEEDQVPHRVLAQEGGQVIGKLDWNATKSGQIADVFVEKPFRRRGIATEMFKHAQHISSQFDDVPPPTHNDRRTDEGDAWARSVGGVIPQKTEYRRQFNNLWNE